MDSNAYLESDVMKDYETRLYYPPYGDGVQFWVQQTFNQSINQSINPFIAGNNGPCVKQNG